MDKNQTTTTTMINNKQCTSNNEELLQIELVILTILQMLLKILKKNEDDPFSKKEILKLVDNKANLVVYPDIQQYRTIDDLLGPYYACIILYVTNINDTSIFGHWTCIFRISPDTIEYFDSYGYPPDNKIIMSNYNYEPYLTNLIKKSKQRLIYNPYELQSRKNTNVSTCGRWVGMRLNFRSVSLNIFVNLMNSMKKTNKLTPDDIVTLLTSYVK